MLDSYGVKEYSKGVASVFGNLQSEICRACGHRHFDRSRNNRICGSTVDHMDWLASAKGIAELARNEREEGIARTNWAAQQPEGPRRDRHLRCAAEAFAKAYELEN